MQGIGCTSISSIISMRSSTDGLFTVATQALLKPHQLLNLAHKSGFICVGAVLPSLTGVTVLLAKNHYGSNRWFCGAG
ncbi:expressed protein [Echinococcus multilocularis]|uniref:Expressed protein n=1 Tax=Echinococcus multilocularis TaxID=6211 RepID=A0A087W1I6_ECHMU|nr:expressed protein [Echinococcus multilocularis]